MAHTVFMLDANAGNNQAFLDGSVESFTLWIERSSLASAARTAEAFAGLGSEHFIAITGGHTVGADDFEPTYLPLVLR